MPVLGSGLVRNTVGFMLAGVAVILAIVVASAWLATRTQEHSQDLVSAQKMRAYSSTMLVGLLDAETGQRGYVLTADPKYLKPYEDGKPQVYEAIKNARSMTNDPAIAATIDRLNTVVDAKFAELENTIALTKAGKRDEAVQVVHSDRGKELMNEARKVIGDFRQRSDSTIASIVAVMRPESQKLIWTTVLGGGLIMLFAAGAFVTVARHTRQLEDAQRTVQELNAGLEERVAERTSDLTRANEEIQRFAYIVSHDLRSPLVNIMGFTSELEVSTATLQKYIGGSDDACTIEAARTAAEEELPEAVRFIRASTNKMDQLINAILKLSREGRRELRPETVDLATLFSSAAASVAHQVDAAGASIEIPDKFPAIVSDRLALEQVFGNLIDNAVKYLSPARAGVIKVAAQQKGRNIEIAVSDNGRGIDEKDHERIFELFRRSGTQDKPGEGIGLAHVRALVRRLGGDITVQSRLGEGATFLIKLPKLLKVTESYVLA